ncbi:MAG: Rab family GTPase [Promethearchaeota archaeon]
MEPSYRFKVVLFGNAAVGKTSLVNRYVNNKFEQEYLSTLGYNVLEKIVDIKGTRISFMIFDIGGQEQFRELRKQYAKGANAALLVYDITNRESFDNMRKWYDDLMQFTDGARFIIVGNKVDLIEMRQVTTEEGDNLAFELLADGFFETSAKENIEIDNAFRKFAQALIE